MQCQNVLWINSYHAQEAADVILPSKEGAGVSWGIEPSSQSLRGAVTNHNNGEDT